MAGKCITLSKLFSHSYINPFTVSKRGVRITYSKQLKLMKKRQDKYFAELSEKEYNELHRRSKFLEWNLSAEVYAFGKRLNEDFKPEVLLQAFTHRSYIVQEELKLEELGVSSAEVKLKDNSKLVEKGQEIISHYVPRYISHFFPRFPLEGVLNIHEYLLSDEVLADISKNLGTTFLILSADYPVEIPTYAKTFKAIVGALHECQGTKRANLFVRDFVMTKMVGEDVNDFLKFGSYQQELNEIFKRQGKEAPEPRIICQSAMNTILANYHVGLYSNKQLIGHYSGESLDIAVEMAALDALKRLFHTTDHHSPMTFDLVEIPNKIVNLKIKEWTPTAFEKS